MPKNTDDKLALAFVRTAIAVIVYVANGTTIDSAYKDADKFVQKLDADLEAADAEKG